MSKVSCIVLAAGAGRRMGHDENKIFIKLGNKSIIGGLDINPFRSNFEKIPQNLRLARQ